MKSFAQKVIDFNGELKYDGKLPNGFQVLNPFTKNLETTEVMKAFYSRFYDDENQRKFIIGINPGRHGAALTGVPFTDTKRLEQNCGIKMNSAYSHELSSVFVYDMIAAFGGEKEFFSQFYINSPFPLAIVKTAKNGKFLNANYYDDIKLFESVKPFMVRMLKKQIDFGLDTSEVYVLGKKNAEYLNKINAESRLFGKISVLEHPRFIQQYKSKEKKEYIEKYLKTLKSEGDE